jgi:hypothetical protein
MQNPTKVDPNAEGWGWWCVPTFSALIIVILLVLIFSRQISYWIKATLRAFSSALDAGDTGGDRLLDDDDLEHLDNPAPSAAVPGQSPAIQLPPGQSSDTLLALGYTGTLPWDEVMQATEIDPSTFVNHMDYVKDVRRFSSGANFTSVTDDNTNIDFTNFRGLRRPQAIPNMIGASARQVPDIDENVLLRNKDLRW